MKTKIVYLVFLAVTAALLLQGCSGENQKAIRIGDTVASFSGTDLEGRTFSLDALKGKPVVMRFFLTDCEYCRADTPVFNKFYQEQHVKDNKKHFSMLVSARSEYAMI